MGFVQKRIAKAGLSKQTGKGSPAAAATYAYGLRSGRVIGAEIQQETEEVTVDTRVNPGANRNGVIPGMEYVTRGYPKLLGLLLYGALGSISSSGSGPTSHTITPGDDLPYLTAFGRQGSEYYQLKDAKLDQLRMSWDGPGPIEVGARFIGLDLDPISAPTETNQEADSGGKFRAAGGTFKLDIDSDTPVAAPVSKGEISIANAIEAVMLADSIQPNDVFPGVLVPSVSLTLKPNDLLRWREIVFGAAAGTDVSAVPIYGSFEVKFVLDANTDLTISATRVPFMAEFPEVDPRGGAQELVVTGEAMKPTGAAITAVLRNSVASY